MRLAIPDLISNSYFPALAAAELGFFEREGLQVSAELIFPVDRAYEALRDGAVDFVGGAAHGALAAFPGWRGVKLLGALAQGMYWFLVMRKELGIARGDLAALRGRRIGAAPWVEMGLRGLLSAAGLDPHRNDIRIGPVPGATGSSVNFGLTAAKALEAGAIDGFWANETAAAAVRALVAAQNALKTDVSRATKVGEKRFPPREAGLIAGIIRRDLPFYDATIGEKSVSAISEFARSMSVLDDDVPYADVVATRFRHLWHSGA